MAPQLTAQDGNDGGYLGGGEAWLVEEEDELGNKPRLVSNFSIPGSFPGEPRREAVEAFTGMNQICYVSAKRFHRLGLLRGPLTPMRSWQLVKTLSDTHRIRVCPVPESLGDEPPGALPPLHPLTPPPLKTAFKDNPSY